uniref:AH domain-containing protein n=2 Tax=Meloidogyne incognita group TaxID=654580 RepID=A0A914L3B1_MELIC
MLAEKLDTFDTVEQATEVSTTPKEEKIRDVPGQNPSVTRQSPPLNGPRRTSNPVQGILDLATNSQELQQLTTATAAKIDSLKKWTLTTYKNTKHLYLEHMGKIDKTSDLDLNARIAELQELRKCYRELLSNARNFTNYMVLANNMQKCMASALCELATKETAISKELNMQSELFSVMGQHSEPLQRSLSLFLSSLQTLCDNTIEDTFLTIESHNQARLEFDVGRKELQAARENPNSTAQTIAVLEEQCNQQRAKYEQLKEDVRAKLVLLEENRCKVMRKQILALHKSFGQFHLNCSQAVENSTGSNDFTKMAVLNGGQDSLPTNLAYGGSNGFQSFLEK